MSDKTNTTTNQQDPQASQQPADAANPAPAAAEGQQEQQDGQQDDGRGGGNKEAAKYRRQLREVEAERDGLATTVETLRRQVVATAMPTDRIKPDALWATGRNAAEFFDEAGQLDAAKLSSITKETAAKLGVPLQDVVHESGRRSGVSVEPKATWSDALKRRA